MYITLRGDWALLWWETCAFISKCFRYKLRGHASTRVPIINIQTVAACSRERILGSEPVLLVLIDITLKLKNSLASIFSAQIPSSFLQLRAREKRPIWFAWLNAVVTSQFSFWLHNEPRNRPPSPGIHRFSLFCWVCYSICSSSFVMKVEGLFCLSLEDQYSACLHKPSPAEHAIRDTGGKRIYDIWCF